MVSMLGRCRRAGDSLQDCGRLTQLGDGLHEAQPIEQARDAHGLEVLVVDHVLHALQMHRGLEAVLEQ